MHKLSEGNPNNGRKSLCLFLQVSHLREGAKPPNKKNQLWRTKKLSKLCSPHNLKTMLINVRSVKNKSSILNDLINEIFLDILFIPETSLSYHDSSAIVDFLPSRYSWFLPFSAWRKTRWRSGCRNIKEDKII